MKFPSILSDTTFNDLPHSNSPVQEPLEPFLTEIAKSKGFFLDLSKRGSFSSTSTSDSGRSESSREEKLSNDKSYHQLNLERRHKNFQVKKKTELCKTYQLGLICPYGAKCSFAHGVEELRGKLLVPTNYKTVNCKQYYELSYCNYGPRCQFVHKIPEKVSIPSIEIGYQTIQDHLARAVDYNVCNGLEIRNLSGFLKQTTNPVGFGLRRLKVFEGCIEEH